MTDHITAAELRVLADHPWTMADERQALRRAAAALDAKDARIAELEEERAHAWSECDELRFTLRVREARLAEHFARLEHVMDRFALQVTPLPPTPS
jgi:hypothetical protein